MRSREFDITGSIVLFKNSPQQIRGAIACFLNTKLRVKLYLIDNSPSPIITESIEETEYVFNNANLGFGRAHNIAMQKAQSESNFHLVLNPDVSFKNGTLEVIFEYMVQNRTVGLLLPKVLDETGKTQFLAKLLPHPRDLVYRRLFPNGGGKVDSINYRFEQRFKDYNKLFEAPYLSGCFMFIRSEVITKIGGFDERYFMYMEDVDLSRRIHCHYRTIYFPMAEITHLHAKDSYKRIRTLLFHVVSAFKYFTKYGWFVDRDRKRINTNISSMGQ